MTKYTILNLTNSPLDLEGGVRVPAMDSVMGEFSDEYAAILRICPGLEIEEAEPDRPARKSSAKKDDA